MKTSHRVLVTDGGNGQNRSTLAAVRALAAAGYEATVTVSGEPSLAGASRSCAARVEVPPVDDPEYAAAVREVQQRGGSGVVLPASDAALVALGLPGAQLVDKSQVAVRAELAGLPVLSTQRFPDVEALRAAAHDLTYPLVVKPEVRRSSRQPPVRRVDSAEALRELLEVVGPVVVQPFVQEPMSAVSGVIWQGRLVAVVTARYLRTWPVNVGVASALETVPGDPELEERLVQVLQGHNGVFQAQLIGPYLIDLNPRVFGSLPLAVAAGANLPGLVVELSAGRPAEPVVRGRTGVRYRWLEGDLRHLRSRQRCGELSLRGALSEFRPRAGTAHSTESLRDPGPMLVRLRHAWTSRGSRA